MDLDPVFRSFVEGAPDAVFLQVDGRVAYLNPAAVRLLGARAPEELLGRALMDHVHPDVREAAWARLRLLSEAGQATPPMEQRYLRLDGSAVDVEVSAVPLVVDGTAAALVFARDIGARKQAERALLARARQLEALRAVGEEMARELDLGVLLQLLIRRAVELAGAATGTVFLWEAARGVLVSRAWHGLGPWQGSIELRPGEAIAGTVAKTREGLVVNDYRTSPYAHPITLQHTQLTASLGEPLLYRGELVGAITLGVEGGRTFTAEDQALLRLFAIQAAIAIQNARLHAAGARRAEELAALLRASRSIMTGLDLQTILDRIVEEAAAITGCVHVKLLLVDREAGVLRVGAVRGTAMDPDDALPIGASLSGIVAATGEPLFTADARTDPRNVFQEGDRRLGIVSYLALPIRIRDEILGVLSFNTTAPRSYAPDELAYLASFADQAALAIENARLFGQVKRRSEELQALFTVTDTVTRSLDVAAITRAALLTTLQLLGAEAGRLYILDEQAQVLRLMAHHGLPADVLDAAATYAPGEGIIGRIFVEGRAIGFADTADPAYRAMARSQLGRRLGFRSSAGLPISIQGRPVGVIHAFRRAVGRFTDGDLALLAAIGGQIGVAIENARLYADLKRSYDALERAQEELVRTEKLRGLGQMATGIAHDFNNTLAAILGQIELLRLRALAPEVQDGLRTLQTAVSDGAQVVRRLQDFARRRGEGPLGACDLDRLVREALEITRPRWREQPQREGRLIRTEIQLGGLPPVEGNPAEIRELLTNLIFNAVDAMPNGGTLTFAGRRLEEGRSGTPALPRSGADAAADGRPGAPECRGAGAPASAWVELSVSDTGVGMTEEVRRRAFDPFFTTKGMHGSGLGLSVAYGIMQRHGGQIEVASTPGRGSTLRLRFRPAASAKPDAPAPPPAVAAPARRVLLIDDDPTVRETLACLLRAAGQHVLEADGGRAGLARLAAEPVDLVLTDLGMPEVTGWDVAREVKGRRPDLPVIVLTGWGDQAAAEMPRDAGVDRVLTKPVQLAALLGVIGELLPPP
ncbi:MAG: GAF domain-containing protein [Candidatus Methylomirabilales bacterium]